MKFGVSTVRALFWVEYRNMVCHPVEWKPMFTHFAIINDLSVSMGWIPVMMTCLQVWISVRNIRITQNIFLWIPRPMRYTAQWL